MNIYKDHIYYYYEDDLEHKSISHAQRDVQL